MPGSPAQPGLMRAVRIGPMPCGLEAHESQYDPTSCPPPQDRSMQIRNLGGSGLRVSAVGLGCNNFGQRTDLETSRKVIHKAIDLGVTLFDTADIYAGMGGSETVLGQVLGDRRKDIVLATKYSKPMSDDGTKQGASRRYIMSAVEASLTRLKTDYIDLYQQHDYDPLTPIEETLRALDDLIRQGKVRYIGNSNFPAWRVAEAEFTARAINVSRFVSCQDEYSLVVRDIEKDLLPAAQEYKLGLLPFFPLASGKNGSRPSLYSCAAGSKSFSMSRTTRLYSSWHDTNRLALLARAVNSASATRHAGKFELPM